MHELKMDDNLSLCNLPFFWKFEFVLKKKSEKTVPLESILDYTH